MVAKGPGCVKTCLSQGCAELFSQFPSLDRTGKCNWFSHRQNREGISTRKLNVRVFTQVRRETGKEQVVQVHYDEGIANHIGPEPCAGIREDVGEASVGERAGQPLSRDRKLIPGADAVCVAEGNMSKSANASAWATRRGRRTWHARKLFVREPGDLRIGHRPLGVDGPRREGEEP